MAPIDSRLAEFAAQHGDDDRHEQRDRDGGRDDDRRAQVAQEQPLDQEDQGDAEHHVVQHRVHGDGDQIAAIVERHDLHALRQACRRC